MRNPFRRRRTAAITQIDSVLARQQFRTRQQWQARATFFARNLGIARFAAGLIADSGSRCRIVTERQNEKHPDEWDAEDAPLPSAVMRAYEGKDQDAAELVRSHLWLYETVGELVAMHTFEQDRQGPREKRLRWELRSPLSVVWQGNGVLVRDIEGGSVLDKSARLVPFEHTHRLWIPDETWSGLATSPMQGVMEDLERLWSLTRRMRREGDSALVMNKILWTPKEAHDQLPQELIGPDGVAHATSLLEQQWIELSKRAYNDDDSVAAIAPPMLNWAKEFGEPKTIDVGRALDPHMIEYLTATIEAIARGLDYPQRLLVDGGGGMNHWGVWLMEDQFARNSLAPKLSRVGSDVTAMYLRPALRALRDRGLFKDDPEKWRVGFDMTPVVVHPDQSRQVIELYNLGVVGDETVLRVTGLSSGDAPSPDEMARWVERTKLLHSGGRQGQEQAPGVAIESIPATAALLGPRAMVSVGPYPSEAARWLDD